MKKKLLAFALVLLMIPGILVAAAQEGFAESMMDLHHVVIGGDQSITIRSHADPCGPGGYSQALYAVELNGWESSAELDAEAVRQLLSGADPVWGGSKHCYHGSGYTADPTFTLEAADFAPGSYLYVCYAFGCDGSYNHNLTPYYERISTMGIRITEEVQGLDLRYALTDGNGSQIAALTDGGEAVLAQGGTVRLKLLSDAAYPAERIVGVQAQFPGDQAAAPFTFDEASMTITPVLCGSGSITVTIGNYLDDTNRTETIHLTVPCTPGSEPTVLLPASCTEDGLAAYCCPGYGINCDSYFEAFPLPATGHELFSVSQFVQKPTATKPGIGMGTCKKCGLIGVETALDPIFCDVVPDDYYSEPLDYCHAKGWVSGVTDNTFEPESSCLRSQVVTFLWRAAGCPKPGILINPFTDVKEQTYYYDAVLWALEKGITDGTDPGFFSPNQACTRSQVVTFLWRAFGQPENETAHSPFTDVKAGDWYEQSVLWAVENGITDGTGAGQFSPKKVCSRAQIVTFLYRAYAE